MSTRVTVITLSFVWLALTAIADQPSKPIPLIFDTDIGNDVDDVLALGMIHAMESRGECRLLAVTITKDHELAAAFTDAVNTFYGRGNLAIGIVKGGATPEASRFTPVAQARDAGALVYPHDLVLRSPVPDAVNVLREVLARQPDDSVVIVQVGFSSNLARLLESPGDDHSPLDGLSLAARKVRLISIMAGAFSPIRGDTHLEYNVIKDIPAAQTLASRWPTPIVWSGFEIGLALPFPATSIDQDFRYVDRHLIPV